MSRGVHGSVQVGSVPNPQLTRWHRVLGETTHSRPQKPTGQVGSDWKYWRSSRSKPTKCCRRLLLGGDLYFLSNLRWICVKLTRPEQKKNQIVVGFLPNSRDVSKKISNSRQICSKFTRSKQKIRYRYEQNSWDLSKTQHIFTGSKL